MVRDTSAEDDLEFDDEPQSSRRRATAKPPGLVNAMAIIDLILSGFTLIGVAFGTLGLVAASRQPELLNGGTLTVGPLNYASLGIQALLGVAGLVAGILILRRRPAGLSFGWLAAGLTVLSIILGAVLALQTVNQMSAALPDPSAQSVAKAAGLGSMVFTVASRAVILGLYVVALNQFKKWVARNG